jgi:glycosyltransferase involved in cell wall biosynthesis
LLAGKLFNRPGYVRFFGGRPMLEFTGKLRFLRTIPLVLLGLANRIVIETDLGANEFPKFLQKKIVVVPGYRPRTKSRMAKNLVENDQSVKFVYVGEISSAKGFDILLEAYSNLVELTKGQLDIELHVYGTGSQVLIDQLQTYLGAFYFGKIENAELRRKLVSHDIFVFPSTYISEGHPGVLIEALMAGLPVISSDLPGPRELVEDHINGLLVPSGNVQGLLKAMEELVRDPMLREHLAQGAHKSSGRFDVECVLPQLADRLGIVVT